MHLSGPLVVRRTVLQLASSVDPGTGATEGPLVYVGEEEYTLHQAEALIDALTHLVDKGTGRTPSPMGDGVPCPRPDEGAPLRDSKQGW